MNVEVCIQVVDLPGKSVAPENRLLREPGVRAHDAQRMLT